MIRSTMLAVLAALVLPIAPARGQPAPDYAATYRKREVMIPMRDGVRLFTAIYEPKDTSRTWPILMNRTPYSVRPYGSDAFPRMLGPAPQFAPAGYVIVSQDVRGRYRSEGKFVHMTPHKRDKGPRDVDESTDTWDTIEWLIHNVPRNNGKVGLLGISYPGFFAAAGMIDAHPALAAVSPQAPQADWFMGDDTHHNGAFFLASTFNFMASCGRLGSGTSMECGRPFDFGTKDGYQFFLDLGPLGNADAKYFKGQVPGWTEMMEHGTYDRFWQDRNILRHVRNIRPAVLTVGGWYDANNFYGALQLFLTIEKESKGTSNSLVIGPWYHGQWARDEGTRVGDLTFGSKTSEEYREQMLFPFFEYHLKGKGGPPPRISVYETGANRWRTFDTWPPKEAASRSIYLDAAGKVSFQPPSTKEPAADKYLSDPAKPVPSVPGQSTDMDPDYMARDQRFAMGRPDVLVYQGQPLDAEMTIAGAVSPSLFVSTTGTDGDWIVKVIDVHPDGTQELVRGDVMRAKFRNSFEKPEPMVPGQPTRLDFVMPDVLHTFRKGHRIMVQVQGSWFPLVDRNPQKFVDIYRAAASDFQAATQTIHRSARYPSRVMISVLPEKPTP